MKDGIGAFALVWWEEMKNSLPWDGLQVTRSVPQQICRSNGGISHSNANDGGENVFS